MIGILLDNKQLINPRCSPQSTCGSWLWGDL